MGRIRVLPDTLINRIAAGEVVERPASVVKELVENSIDAGSRSIRVECAGGGRRLIAVSDDGRGMDRDDVLLALERHATSKLSAEDDLETIGTLGFRGEALSSIAAVSRFTLRSATEDGAGTEVEVHAGRIHAVRETGMPRGTAIRVERLFYNVPARRKFLRTDSTELSHIARGMTRFALSHHAIRFRLDHSGRELLRTDPAETTLDRIAQIYGDEFARKLEPFGLERHNVRVHGFAGRPAEALPRRDGQHFFVNGRSIHDRVLLHAASEAYENTTPRGRYPSLFLFVDCPPTSVDVNVHPQKAEVRFRHSREIHDLAADAVRSALSGEAVVPALSDLRSLDLPAAANSVAEAVSDYLERSGSASRAPRVSAPTPATAHSASSVPPEPGTALPFAAEGGMPQERIAGAASGTRALAQYRDSYILAQDARGLMLVDQHAAHERVIFERYLAQARENRVEIQELMFPVTLELTAADRLIFEEEREEFRRLGFVAEWFGGDSIRVSAVPALTGSVDPAQLILELLGEAREAKSAVAVATGLRHRLVTSAACQAAIKVHHPLDSRQMQRLLDDLFQTVNVSTCPHGRPLVFRLSHDEIERAFGRR